MISQTDKKRILIADDEPNIRALVSSMLEEDYIVFGASDGQETINITRSQKPDLILMDILMPKIDGYTACSVVKTEPATKGILVIMLTGIGHDLNQKLAQAVGADGYITKPFTLQNLRDTVAQFLKCPK